MASKLIGLASKIISGLEKETSILQTLDGEVRATINRLDAESPGLKAFLNSAHAYVVFPSVGKAAIVIGGAFGKGEVFQGGKLIGYAAVAQLTLGVQLGGDTFSEIIAFENKQALERFKQGKTAFAANASAVLIKAGASSTSRYEKGVAVLVHSEGGLMLEAAIGGQRFFFRAAFLGRLKTDNPAQAKKASPRKRLAQRTPASVTRPKSRRSKQLKARRARTAKARKK